ncbi:MAG: prolipoprotein diacylglyceryl transferase [Candidatus Aminicenantes bacterium]|nr:prolipoprotein diacylglyceryl transferase [Candidatus Aminicenantes bacterium]
MYPILIKIGPLTIHTYGFMMALGVALALWFLYVQAKKQDLAASKLIDVAFYTIIVALLGAKLVLFFGDFSFYVENPKQLLSLARSGGVFQGGLAFGFFFALWLLHKNKIPAWKTADIIAPALALGHSLGRLGCFAAGCCYGSECTVPWGVKFQSEYSHNLTGVELNTLLHPVQLYEAFLNFTNFLILFFILRKKRFDGQVISFYIINYSIIRYVVEFFRGDHEARVYFIQNASPYLSISYPQLFSILGFIAGIVLFFVLKKRQKA